jgi:NCAIR mutase (PurE)-related protein
MAQQVSRSASSSTQADAPADFLRTLLQASGAPIQVDHEREQRKGVPEVVLAEGKRPDDLSAAIRALIERSDRVLVSRLDASAAEQLVKGLSAYQVEHVEAARMAVVRKTGIAPRSTGGRVGLLTAGTSDVGVAHEAAVVAHEMGCEVIAAFDVGVAGLHRLVEPLERFRERDVDVVIVAAGMDGALPSVVAGLLPVPVIGLPVSTGYGVGGKGEAALLSMLQTCAPGLTVVNIDNGVGAGASAALIANRMARLRLERASHPRSVRRNRAAPRV